MCMIMMFYSCVYEELNQCVISYYYHKCQSYSSAQRAVMSTIFQLDSLPGKILFLSFRLGFFLEIGKKGGYFGLGMGPIFGPW